MLSPHQIVSIAVRLLAFVLFYHILATIAQHAQLDTPQPYWFHAAAAVLAVWLWCFPNTLARRLLPDHAAKTEPSPATPAPWLTTGLVLLGMYQFIQGITNSVFMIGLMYYTNTELNTPNTAAWLQTAYSFLSPEHKSNNITAVFELVSGVLLMRFAARLSVRLIKIVR